MGTAVGGDAKALTVAPVNLGLYQELQPATITVTNGPKGGDPGEDFNGDGSSDILLQNAIAGSCHVWELNG